MNLLLLSMLFLTSVFCQDNPAPAPTRRPESPLKTGLAPERTREQLEKFAASQGWKLRPLTKKERKRLEAMIGRQLFQKELDYFSAMPPETRLAWVQGFIEDEHQREWEVKDRARYVLPAPPDFVPEDVPRKIRLTLRIEKPVVRVSEVTHRKYRLKEAKPLRYQALMQNVGREEILFSESAGAGSFFKRGFRWPKFDFHIITPQGKTMWLDLPYEGVSIRRSVEYSPPGWERLTREQKLVEIARINDERRHAAELWLHLKPGETLVTKPEEGPGEFCDLESSYYEMKHNGLGTYKLKLVYNDPPFPPPTEKELQDAIKRGRTRAEKLKLHQELNSERFGIVESNAVEIEVLP